MYSVIHFSSRESRFALSPGGSINLGSSVTGYTSSSFSKKQTALISSGVITYETAPLDLTEGNSYVLVTHDTTLTSSLPLIFGALGTIDHGPANINFTSGTVTMSFDAFLSTDHTMRFLSSSVLDGNGHFINFATRGSPLLLLDPSVSVTLSNVVLKGDFESQISYGAASSLLFGANSIFEFNDSHDLSTTLSFAGNAKVNGNGKILTIQSGGNIITTPGSTLTLKNMIIRGVKDSNIRCLDDTAKIVFENVKLDLESNYSFTVGAFNVNESLHVTGSHYFIYSSAMTSTILSKSELFFDHGTVFFYFPPVFNNALLVLEDRTSMLHFNDSILGTNLAGLLLTKGILKIDGLVTMFNGTSPFIPFPIIFGNTVASDNLVITISPGAGLSLDYGFLDYKNTV